MAKAKLLVKGNVQHFKVACAASDVEIVDAIELGDGLVTKVEVSFKNPSQLRDLGQYEAEIAAKN